MTTDDSNVHSRYVLLLVLSNKGVSAYDIKSSDAEKVLGFVNQVLLQDWKDQKENA